MRWNLPACRCAPTTSYASIWATSPRSSAGPSDNTVGVSVDGKPAVEIIVQRSEQGDTLEAARNLAQWLDNTRPTLPPGVEIAVYDASWELVRDRIMLLVRNGIGGLVLVVLILYLFLTGRVAFWVAWGIPVSFAATLFILYLTGGSINMISLFALIMALGIIVDDAIVVGEDAMAHYQMGEAPLLAAEGGARRMLAPVIASSLTTIAAFLPLMLVGGRIGNILGAIPLVIICVILASLVESFLVLPGHLRNAFVHSHKVKPKSVRARLDRGFEYLRDRLFRPFAIVAIRNRFITVASALAMLIVAVGLIAGGRVSFVFFPTPESQILSANVTFVAGTPRATVDTFLAHLEETLLQTERELDQGQLINVVLAYHGSKGSGGAADQLGGLQIELTEPDVRPVRNNDFIRAWRERIVPPPGLESLNIAARRVGPPGRDLTIRLSGADAEQLKSAAIDLAETLGGIDGVLEVEDDMAYGREQLIYSLTPAGEALGLTVADLGQQLRTAFDGQLVQIFQDGPDEVEVRVRLPEAERNRLSSLYRLNVRTPDGRSVPLTAVAEWRSRRGFEVLRHADGKLAVEVTADVDTTANNANLIIAALEEGPLEELRRDYGIDHSFEGRSADQRETLSDMRKGLILGLILIYLILAWVFSSYGWPVVVMAVIPFGLTGALFGHWVMGIDLTILSLFGMFGLSGIVVNDSIILVSFYKNLRADGMAVGEALGGGRLPAPARGAADLADHHRRSDAVAVREVLSGPVPDPDGHVHRLRPRLRHRVGAARDPVTAVDARERTRAAGAAVSARRARGDALSWEPGRRPKRGRALTRIVVFSGSSRMLARAWPGAVLTDPRSAVLYDLGPRYASRPCRLLADGPRLGTRLCGSACRLNVYASPSGSRPRMLSGVGSTAVRADRPAAIGECRRTRLDGAVG